MRWSSFGSEGAAGRVTSGWVPLRPAQKERRVRDVWCPVPWGPCLRRRPRKQGSLEGDMMLWCSWQGQPQSTLGELLCWTHHAELSHLELFLPMSTSHWMGATQGRAWPLQVSNPRKGQQAEAAFPLQSQQLGQQIPLLERGSGSTSLCPPTRDEVGSSLRLNLE